MHDTVRLPKPLSSRATVFAAIGAGVLLALGIALWAHYGGAVFHEMILAGIALCF